MTHTHTHTEGERFEPATLHPLQPFIGSTNTFSTFSVSISCFAITIYLKHFEFNFAYQSHKTIFILFVILFLIYKNKKKEIIKKKNDKKKTNWNSRSCDTNALTSYSNCIKSFRVINYWTMRHFSCFNWCSFTFSFVLFFQLYVEKCIKMYFN